MHRDDGLLFKRIDRFIRDQVQPRVVTRRTPLTVTRWDVAGEPVPIDEARRGTFVPAGPGEAWGAPWSTTWFRLRGAVPAEYRHGGRYAVELLVDLGFTSLRPGFQCEGLVYDGDTILKGVNPLNTSVPWPDRDRPIDVLVEAAANPDVAGAYDFRPTRLGSRETAGDEPLYRFGEASVVERDLEAWHLERDLWTLIGLARELPDEQPRRRIILTAVERMMDAFDPAAEDAPPLAREQIAPLFSTPAWASSHRLHAVGHAHIDSAWLWPVRETKRKIVRTVANVLALMDEYPDLIFAFSQAQQLEWLRESAPDLFERVRDRVAEGRFVPVGGMWVESDTNMPSGESLVRQFLEGDRFFSEHFGLHAREVWLPDSFGYSAALPQIALGVGAEFFLTQKISWNRTNRMPHHTFRWEGIDGSRIFTHFPPVDMYHSELSGAELAHAERTFSENGAATRSLVPFGWGDGGGGPTREMMEAAHRTQDLEGSPVVAITPPAEFFAAAREEYPDAPLWSGELYLELHRGVYTSQARTKRGNRRSEALLHAAELWATTAMVRTGAAYPHDELRSIWHTVLLGQFHDILPGSSIAWVHRQVEREYADVEARLHELISTSLRALAGSGKRSLRVNAAPVDAPEAPAFGAEPAGPAGPPPRVEQMPGGGLRVARDADELLIDERGRIAGWTTDGRELVPAGRTIGDLALARDLPVEWDAWDVEDYARRAPVAEGPSGPLAVRAEHDEVVVEVQEGVGEGSRITRVLRIPAGERSIRWEFDLDWREREKLLKLEIPVSVATDHAVSEIQFGHVRRSITRNTSWDEARFETVAHRWLHVGEPDLGLAIANDALYGHDVVRGVDDDGERSTTVRLSMLRAPLFPDPDSDQGRHRITVALRPTSSLRDAIDLGYRTWSPTIELSDAAVERIEPLVRSDHPGIVIETVKAAADASGEVIVRAYEAHGARADGWVRFGFPVETVRLTDLLERPLEETVETDGDAVRLHLRPFRIVTLRVTPRRG